MKTTEIDQKRLNHARDEFALVFYRWALTDADKQAAAGFPLFASLRDSLATRHARVYDMLPPEKKGGFLKAMVKRAHPRALELNGEFITAEERDLVQHFIRPPWENDRGELEAGWNRPRLTSDDRKRLAKAVKQRIANETGGEFEEWMPTLFSFCQAVEPWQVCTRVSIKSKQNLGYEQSIAIGGHPEIRLKEYTSITRWLGIGETDWDYMKPDEIEECAQSVIVLAKYFLDAVPGLLAKVTL